MAAQFTIGFLGAGRMATALARGVISVGLVKAAQIRASDPGPAARAGFGKETGAKAGDSNLEVVRFGRVLVLAVKPGQVPELLAEIRSAITREHLLISIAAGVPLANWRERWGVGCASSASCATLRRWSGRRPGVALGKEATRRTQPWRRGSSPPSARFRLHN